MTTLAVVLSLLAVIVPYVCADRTPLFRDYFINFLAILLWK